MASKRRLRRRSCERKVRHEDPGAAWAMVKRLHRTKGDQGNLQVYRCPFCGGWHVGHGKERR